MREKKVSYQRRGIGQCACNTLEWMTLPRSTLAELILNFAPRIQFGRTVAKCCSLQQMAFQVCGKITLFYWGINQILGGLNEMIWNK